MMSLVAILAAGLALGMAGSGHCAVMCGPLVLLSQPRAAGRGVILHVAAYHAGRSLAYAVFGLVAGGAGGWIVGLGFGRALAIAAAAALIAQVIWHWRGPSVRSWPWLTRAIGVAGRFMRRHPVVGPATFGALTGLLPCGLVYAAATTAAGLGGAIAGAVFMIGFAGGSVPALATIAASSKMLQRRQVAGIVKRLAPVGLAIAALLIIFRASGMHAEHAAPAAAPGHSAAAAHHHH
jgi:sulfite exporter TauE/SafE